METIMHHDEPVLSHRSQSARGGEGSNNLMLHIFLAEDNPGDVVLVGLALDQSQLAYKLDIARDGAEAIEYISHMGEPGHTRCPDVILLDLNLPKIEGSEVLRAFREHAACEETPVIIVTSSDAQKDRGRLADLGISHYFRKPITYDAFMQLGDIVRDVVDRKAG